MGAAQDGQAGGRSRVAAQPELQSHLVADGTGLLHTPLDVLLTGTGDALVTDSDSGDIEMFAVP